MSDEFAAALVGKWFMLDPAGSNGFVSHIPIKVVALSPQGILFGLAHTQIEGLGYQFMPWESVAKVMLIPVSEEKLARLGIESEASAR